MGRFVSMGRAAAEPEQLARKPFEHAMGYYEANGSWHQQTVHLGVTQSGTPGLFTGNTLAWPIEPMLNEMVSEAAHWCYKQLEDNYEYDTGDEAAESGIEANEYDFNREGERIDRPARHAGQRVGPTKCPATT